MHWEILHIKSYSVNLPLKQLGPEDAFGLSECNTILHQASSRLHQCENEFFSYKMKGTRSVLTWTCHTRKK